MTLRNHETIQPGLLFHISEVRLGRLSKLLNIKTGHRNGAIEWKTYVI